MTSYDVLNMGRSSIDLYSNDVGAPFPQITSFAFGAGEPSPGKVTTWYDDIAISNDRPGCTF